MRTGRLPFLSRSSLVTDTGLVVLGIAWAVASALRPAPTRPICGAAGASRMGGDPGAGHPTRTAGSVGVWRAGEVLGEFPEPAGLVVVA